MFFDLFESASDAPQAAPEAASQTDLFVQQNLELMNGELADQPMWEGSETAAAADQAVPQVSEYVGPSSQVLEMEVEQARKDVESAEARLETAIENGAGVISAMQVVESARRLLDTRIKQYNLAVAAENGVATMSGKQEGNGQGLGSVSHAQWELEQAIESGNSIAIENRKRDLAHEIAKEEAKKMQGK